MAKGRSRFWRYVPFAPVLGLKEAKQIQDDTLKAIKGVEEEISPKVAQVMIKIAASTVAHACNVKLILTDEAAAEQDRLAVEANGIQVNQDALKERLQRKIRKFLARIDKLQAKIQSFRDKIVAKEQEISVKAGASKQRIKGLDAEKEKVQAIADFFNNNAS